MTALLASLLTPTVRRWMLPLIGLTVLAVLALALGEAQTGALAESGPRKGVQTTAVAAAPAPQASAPPSAASLNALTPAQRDAVRALVRDYILENPEIIPEAISKLQNREVTRLLDRNRSEIETPFGSAWAGNPNADVVLVEFYDFACPYCAAAKADVDRLLREDRQLKVVYRDYPVISEASHEAAVASLSAAAQGRHGNFYSAMFNLPGRLTHEKVVAAVRKAGLSEIRTAKDLQAKANQAEIVKNIELGEALGLSGTPAYIVGNQVLVGAVGYDKLKVAVGDARQAKRQPPSAN